jgi:hypothetical protein
LAALALIPVNEKLSFGVSPQNLFEGRFGGPILTVSPFSVLLVKLTDTAEKVFVPVVSAVYVRRQTVIARARDRVHCIWALH